MASPEHLKILKQGVQTWNEWREDHPDISPDLMMADLRGENLSEANLRKTNFTIANLHKANLENADLRETDLSNAWLGRANFMSATLEKASLVRANLLQATFLHANLQETDLHRTKFFDTVFGNTNLNNAKNLATCQFGGPCHLDYRTIEKSWPLPKSFLQGCGLPDSLIGSFPSLLKRSAPPTLSCFLCYFPKDEDFANRLYHDLQEKGVRCWHALKEVTGGDLMARILKIYETEADLRAYGKLLLILSADTIDRMIRVKSNNELFAIDIFQFLKAEKKEAKRKIFPILLTDIENLQKWECFDAEYGKDFAVEVRKYFIADFSNWKDHDAYQKAFDRLLNDLQNSEGEEAPK